MSTVELFRDAYAGSNLRGLLIDGMPWFVTADVLALLDLNRSSVAALDADEKGVHTLDTPGGAQQVSIISESGLYSLILRSRKPEAKAIKRWITHEVLPQIRRTGQYGISELDLSDPIAAIEAVREREGRAIEVAKAERARADQAEAQARVLTAAIERDAPLVAKAEAHTANARSINRQAFAREVQQWGTKQDINILQEQVYELLRRRGMLIDGHRADRNHATSQAVKSGWAFTHKDVTEDGHPTAVTMINPRGQDLAWKWITDYVRDNGNLVLPPKITGGAA